jgi:hypothetical protein
LPRTAWLVRIHPDGLEGNTLTIDIEGDYTPRDTRFACD